MDYVVEMLNIRKEFPGVVANDDITLQLRQGEIHALLGENGAGKSTLMGMLFGMYQADRGTIRVNGQEVTIKNPQAAALIFGQWKPLGILGATLFFGFASTLANVSQVIPSLAVFPPVILKVFPYVVTLIALVMFSKSSQAPKAAGEPFDSGKR